MDIVEPNDKSGAHAAMRECSEELGIDLDQIELLGNLDCLVSTIGVRLYAVAVRLHTSDLETKSRRSGRVFTVPLQYLLDMEPTVEHLNIGTEAFKRLSVPFIRGYNIDWKIRQNYSVYFYPYKTIPPYGG